MPLTSSELNNVTDTIVASAITCYPHTGGPGNNGTNNRIGTVSLVLAASNWSNAGGGDVMYEVAINFGVLDADTDQTVTHLSFFRGGAYIAFAEVTPNVTVTAGGTLSVAANQIRINGATT